MDGEIQVSNLDILQRIFAVHGIFDRKNVFTTKCVALVLNRTIVYTFIDDGRNILNTIFSLSIEIHRCQR